MLSRFMQTLLVCAAVCLTYMFIYLFI